MEINSTFSRSSCPVGVNQLIYSFEQRASYEDDPFFVAPTCGLLRGPDHQKREEKTLLDIKQAKLHIQ